MKKGLFFQLIIFCWIIVFSSFAVAEGEIPSDSDLSLEELLTLDTKAVGFFSMDVEKAPGAIQKFLMEDLATSSVRTLSDLIDGHVIGMVYGMNEGMGGLVGSRGVLISNNAKTLFMLDSQQLHARSHGFGDWMMSPLLGDINSIEVVNGPSAIVHGSGAINGYFNLIPKNGTNNPGFFATTEYGEFEEAAKLEMGYGMSYGDQKDIYIYGGFIDADGTDDVQDIWTIPEPGDTIPENWVNVYGYKRSNYRIASYWRHDNFSLNAFMTKINPMTNSQWIGRSYLHHGMLGIRPKYTLRFNEANTLDIILSGELHDVGLEDQGSRESHIESKLIYRNQTFEAHQFAMGALYGKRDFKGRDQYFSDDYENTYPVIEAKWTELGVFTEDVITWKWFTFAAGLRWDTQIDSEHVIDSDIDSEQGITYKVEEEGHFSPRVAASYEFAEGSVIKTSYQQGFRYPDANYYNSTKLMNDIIAELGLPDRLPYLKPEQMDSYELNFHQETSNLDFNLVINLFYNKYKDQLTWHNLSGHLPESTLDAMPWHGAVVNLKDDFESYGTEFIVYWIPWDNTRLRVGYGFAETNKLEIKRYHCHQVKANLKTIFFDNRLVLDQTVIWNSKLRKSSSRHIVYEDDRLVFHLAARYNITKNISIKAIGKNLFEDETPATGYSIWDPALGHLGENERKFYISLNTKF